MSDVLIATIRIDVYDTGTILKYQMVCQECSDVFPKADFVPITVLKAHVAQHATKKR